MLAGEPAPAIGGGGSQLQAQTSALGWRIDDLLLTVSIEGIATGRLAISAKGNFQVTAAGLPADFVLRAWEQWRDPAGLMHHDRDGLALVTRGVHTVFDPNWKEIKDACSGSDVALAISRIRNNRKQTRIFDSIRNVVDGTSRATDEETVQLIRHLHVLPVDFQLDHSELASQAIAQCRQILASRDLTEAQALWRYLINVAAEVRLRRGTITLNEIWALLRKQFALRNHPDFARDWETLSNLTADYKARIKTALHSGFTIDRPAEMAKLEASISANVTTTVFGESGTGKSALVKSVLDQRFASWTQVWFGPDELRTALSAARRSSLPLQHELSPILKASANPRNILVFDSAERIDLAELIVIRQLVVSLLPPEPVSEDGAWRLVVISQPQGWVERSDEMLGHRNAHLVDVESIKTSDVMAALWATPSLGWLASHHDTIAILTNLRTLAWVTQAGSAFGSNATGIISHAAVADRLWKYWSEGSAEIQALMMRLARREADFERSFSLSDLDPGDTGAFTRRPTQLPLQLNTRTNRIEFEHDLAADWARFQFLKQTAHDPAQWVALAGNPLWTSALRMLGQFLLRQSADSTNAWDRALEAVEATQLPLAADVLLDALSLDPEAERFMTARADLLFAEHGSRLTRLLLRFHHIGTVPSGSHLRVDATTELYMEARYRSVIIGRWLPIARFLISQRERVIAMTSSAVARLIETWLNGTPGELANGQPMPFRREFTEIALAMVRNVQVEKGHGVIYLADEPLLYTAPLSGAADLPDEIAGWALEMAGRRDISSDVATRIRMARRKQAAERAERLKNDPELREAEKQRRRGAPFAMGRHELPPWPLGARRRVDHDFRKACLKDNELSPLMRARPAAAAEVLLALIVDDQPYEEYGSRHYEIDLGLEFAHEAYPTAFWKSPFFHFLQVAPAQALQALIALVDFCTERWVAEVMRDHEGSLPGIILQMPDGSVKIFTGSSVLFEWTQESSASNGNLHCALDALERMLTLQLDAGVDITPHVEQILEHSTSVAFLGLLVNVGKHRPTLFPGILAPLLTSPLTFYWDHGRVKNLSYKFIGSSWARAGETIFEFAKSWILAPHRQRRLIDIAVELLKTDDGIANRLNALVRGWTLPAHPKLALEFRLMFAALDRGNYHPAVDQESGAEVLALVYPENLDREIAAWEAAHSKPRQHLLVPQQCEEFLQKLQRLSDKSAQSLHDLLSASTVDDTTEPEVKSASTLAMAATLIVCCDAWLTREPAAKEQALAIVKAAVLEVGATAVEIRNTRTGPRHDRLKFAAFAVMHLWIKADADAVEWEALLLRLMTSGDSGAAGIIFAVAHAYRERLGSAWWRLLLAGLLWSALVMLSPNHDEGDEIGKAWNVWLARFRRFPLRRDGATSSDLDIARLAAAYEHLRYDRRVRAYYSGKSRWGGVPERGRSAGLETHFLGIVFGWLINGPGSGDLNEDRHLVTHLWAYEAERARGRKKDTGEYDLPSAGFGYTLLLKLAALSLTVPDGETRSVWEPVLSQGPEAHYAVQHFIRGLFIQLSKGCDKDKFQAVWRAAAQYGLDASWEKRPRHWFHGERMLCDLLGFGNEELLKYLPTGSVLRMRDIYERWAKTHLVVEEESVRGFCHFLTTDIGAPLRLDGLQWIAEMFRARKRSSSWYRDGTGDALIECLGTSLDQNSADLTKNGQARQALVEISADLAARNFPTALTLQERIKLLR